MCNIRRAILSGDSSCIIYTLCRFRPSCAWAKYHTGLCSWGWSGVALFLLNTTCPVLANSVDPDQLASEEANWSESGNQICPAFANSVDPDQLSSEEANWSESAQFATETWYALPLQTEEAHWSGSTQFAIKYVNLYQQPGSSKLIGWKLGMGVES